MHLTRSFFLAAALLAVPLLHAQTAPRTLAVDSPASLAATLESSAPGDVLALAPGTYGAIALKEGQSLQSSDPQQRASAGAVTIAKDVKLTGIDVESIGGTPAGHIVFANVKVSGTVKLTGGDGDVVFENSTLRAHGVAALDVRDSAASITAGAFDVDAGGAANAIVLHNTTGAITLAGGTIRGTSSHAIDIDTAANVTLRDLQLRDNAARSGVSAAACGGDVRGSAITLCTAALFVQNATNVALEKVTIDGSQQLGIGAENVTGFRMTDVEVKNAGNEPNESGVVLRNVGGDVVLTNCRFHDSAARELHIENTKADAHVRIDHSTFAHADAVVAQALLVGASGSVNVTLDVEASTFSGGAANGIHVTGAQGAQLTLHVNGSTFDRNGGAIVAGVTGKAALTYSLTGNTIRRSSLGAINLTASGDSNVAGTIARNEISGAAAKGSCAGCNGISLNANMNGKLTASVDANVIQRIEGNAVRVVAGGASDVRVAVTGNTLREPLPAAAAPAIQAQAGTTSKDTATLCADIRNNTISGTWSPDGAPISLWNRFANTTVKVAGFRGDGKSIAAVAASMSKANKNARVDAKLMADAANAFAAGDRCVTP